jgi:hypothetical protein
MIYKHILTADAIKKRDICYRIRFGTQNKNKQKERVLIDFSPSDAVERQVEHLLRETPAYGYRQTEYKKIFEGGFIHDYLPKYY